MRRHHHRDRVTPPSRQSARTQTSAEGADRTGRQPEQPPGPAAAEAVIRRISGHSSTPSGRQMRARIGRRSPIFRPDGSAVPLRAVRCSTTTRGDEVARGAAQRVAERDEDLGVQTLRGLRHEPVDVLAGQMNAAFLEQRQQLGGLEHATVGHDLPQVPLHLDRPHVFPPSSAALTRASAACRVLFLKSFDTLV